MSDQFTDSHCTRDRKPPVIQIVGYKNSGKTTLVTALIRLSVQQGLRVAVIKHDAHEFQMDHPGTDTYAHTEAGAAAIAITSPLRTAMIQEQPATLDQLIQQLVGGSEKGYDLILVEGFKQEHYPKVVLVADEQGIELLHTLSSIQWIYTRMDSRNIATHIRDRDNSNVDNVPIIPAGKDGIMDLFIALQAYIKLHHKQWPFQD